MANAKPSTGGQMPADHTPASDVIAEMSIKKAAQATVAGYTPKPNEGDRALRDGESIVKENGATYRVRAGTAKGSYRKVRIG